MHRSATMWTCKNVDANVLEDLLGKSWGLRTGQQNCDLLRCYACKDTIVARYHIAQQVYYLAFQYKRWKKTCDSWLPLDFNKEDTIVTLPIGLDHANLKYVNVTLQWILKDVREYLLSWKAFWSLLSFCWMVEGCLSAKRSACIVRNSSLLQNCRSGAILWVDNVSIFN